MYRLSVRKRSRSRLIAALGVLAWLGGKILHPVQHLPDAEFTLGGHLGTFLIFVFWCLGVRAWGRLFAHWFGLRGLGSSVAWALGSAWASFYAALLGHLGWIGAGSEPFFTTALFIGLIAEGYIVRGSIKRPLRRARAWVSTTDWASLFLCALLVLTVFLFVVNASYPHIHSDALQRNFVGPRLWHEMGRIGVPPWNPLVLYCSYWDYFGIWANSFFAGPEGRGLVEVALFTQWVGAFLGAWGSALALFSLLRQINPSRSWRLLAAGAGTTGSVMTFAAWVGKSDWGVAFWTLCGALVLSRCRGSWKRILLAGVFLGMASGAKYTALLTVVPLALLWLAQSGTRSTVPLALGVLLGFGPHLLRNVLMTENPMFAIMNGIFPSPWISESAHSYFQKMEWSPLVEAGGAGWSSLELTVERFKILLDRDPGVLLGIGLLPVAFALRALKRKHLIHCAPIGSFIFFMAAIGAWSDNQEDGSLFVRLVGPGLIWALGLSVILIRALQEHWVRSRWMGITLLAALTAFYVPRYFLNTEVLSALPGAHTKFVHALRFMQRSGFGKAWLRLNAPTNRLILTTNDNHLYYVSHLWIAHTSEQPYLNEVLRRNSWNLKKSLQELRWLEPAYILESTESFALISEMFSMQILEHPDIIAFAAKDSVIIDFDRLIGVLDQACSEPRYEGR